MNEETKKSESATDCAQCLTEHGCGDLSDKSVDDLMRVLEECFDGPGDSGTFLNEDEPALFSMLKALSGEEASCPTAGMSVANHVHHVLFGNDVFLKRLSGDEAAFDTDWSASWKECPLSDAEWKAMQTRLCDQWEKLKPLAREEAPRNFRLVLGLLWHTVFHHGIIRVKFDVLKNRN